jgi:hypothetical protein
MREPTQCVLWSKPELANEPKKGRFELLETFVEESHHWRTLLKCCECGQRYFFEFHEEIDWEDGDDPQYSTYIPVETDAEIEALKEASLIGLLRFFPRLQKDHPKGAKAPSVRWIKAGG